MRLEEEASLEVAAGGQRFFVVVGPPRSDGLVACHLLSDGASVAVYVALVNLLGQVQAVEPAAPDQPEVTVAHLRGVAAATWRAGLARGMRKRLDLWRSLNDSLSHFNSAGETFRRLQLIIFVLENGEPEL